MVDRRIALDEATYQRLAALSEREGKPMSELVREWTEVAVFAAEVVRGLREGDAALATLKARERAARAQVSGFSARHNLSRDQLYRG